MLFFSIYTRVKVAYFYFILFSFNGSKMKVNDTV